MGCFRSGTSAVAGVLHHLGVFMGDVFDQPNKNNPKGFWEDLEFKKILNQYENCDTSASEFCKVLVEQRISQHEIWGFKDPLICNHLGQFNFIDSKLIVCRRSVEDIASSMGRAIGVSDRTVFIPLAEHYVKKLNQSLKEYTGPILEVHKTDSMLQILEPICEFVGLPSNQSAIDFLVL